MTIYTVAAPGNASSGANTTLALVDGVVLELDPSEVGDWLGSAEPLTVSAAVYDQLRERLQLPVVPSEVLDGDLPPRMTPPPS